MKQATKPCQACLLLATYALVEWYTLTSIVQSQFVHVVAGLATYRPSDTFNNVK